MFILSYQFSFIAVCIHVSIRSPWDDMSEEMEITNVTSGRKVCRLQIRTGGLVRSLRLRLFRHGNDNNGERAKDV